MVDIEALKKKIEESGLSMIIIAKRANISLETLLNRLNGIGEFTASEIVGLSSALGLTKVERNKIFLRKKLN